jgi:hypothetical protein
MGAVNCTARPRKLRALAGPPKTVMRRKTATPAGDRRCKPRALFHFARPRADVAQVLVAGVPLAFRVAMPPRNKVV